MNFLAHALLGRSEPALRVGGLAGDWVKGVLPAGLPEDLSRGVALHRAIDSFSERHAAFRASRQRVSAPRRRYAGVLVDMFYDHLLAREWWRYSDVALDCFARETYVLTERRLEQLPEHFRGAFLAMRDNDWLQGYREREAIGRALDRMARHRARQPNPLRGALAEFEAEGAGYGRDFAHFFPDALEFAAQWIRRAGEQA